VGSSPAVVDGTVFVGSGDGHVYALDEGRRTEGSGGVMVPGTDRPLWVEQIGGLAVAATVGAASVVVGRRTRSSMRYAGLALAIILLTNVIVSILAPPWMTVLDVARDTPGIYLAFVFAPTIVVVGVAILGQWMSSRRRPRGGDPAVDHTDGDDDPGDDTSDTPGDVHARSGCPRCERSLDGSEKYCTGCGYSLTDQHCPECETDLEGIEAFCPSCGHELSV